MELKAIIVVILVILSKIEAIYRIGDFAINRSCTEVYSVPTPRYVPYDERYRTKNWLGFTKWKTRINYRYENHLSYQRRSVCCNGYTAYSSTMCIPLCTASCGPHGVCSQPETCKCYEGYLLDHAFNDCKPICANECVNGDCVTPNVCVCKEGYQMLPDGYTCAPICDSCSNLEFCVEPHICRCVDGYARQPAERLDSAGMVDECRPTCDRECINADCVEPNVCRCHGGYVDLDNDVYTCEPKCTRGCYDGFCTAPEVCTCIFGYQLRANSSHVCEPVCTQECINAECISPDICSCNDGYIPKEEESNICEPYCSFSCKNGRCARPDICACDAGYILSEEGQSCNPHCTEDCYMGDCTAPDTCTCSDGYRLTEGSHFVCEPICKNECTNGRCTAPNECTCDDGYEKKNSSDNESRCIVICECENGFCNETSSVCETCAEGYDLAFVDNATVCQPHCEGGCANGQCIEPQKCECNENYVSDNDTLGNPVCVHACGGECEHGTCILENGVCRCLYGWLGKFCNEPSSCAVVIFDDPPILLQLNESTGYDESENATVMEDPWTGPICNSQCLHVIDNTTKCINQSYDEQTNITCFLNIDSPCNTYSIVMANLYKSEINITTIVISSTIALLLVATIISATLIIRKRKKIGTAELVKPDHQQEQRPEEDCLIENEYDGISL